MADFLTRLVERTLGKAQVVQPIIAPLFAPGPTLASDNPPISTWEEVSPVEADEVQVLSAPETVLPFSQPNPMRPPLVSSKATPTVGVQHTVPVSEIPLSQPRSEKLQVERREIPSIGIEPRSKDQGRGGREIPIHRNERSEIPNIGAERKSLAEIAHRSPFTSFRASSERSEGAARVPIAALRQEPALSIRGPQSQMGNDMPRHGVDRHEEREPIEVESQWAGDPLREIPTSEGERRDLSTPRFGSGTAPRQSVDLSPLKSIEDRPSQEMERMQNLGEANSILSDITPQPLSPDAGVRSNRQVKGKGVEVKNAPSRLGRVVEDEFEEGFLVQHATQEIPSRGENFEDRAHFKPEQGVALRPERSLRAEGKTPSDQTEATPSGRATAHRPPEDLPDLRESVSTAQPDAPSARSAFGQRGIHPPDSRDFASFNLRPEGEVLGSQTAADLSDQATAHRGTSGRVDVSASQPAGVGAWERGSEGASHQSLLTPTLSPVTSHQSPVTTLREQIEPMLTDRRGGALASPPSTPTIQVTIGRVEVRATMPPAAPPVPRSKTARPGPALSLDDYLKQRNGGQ